MQFHGRTRTRRTTVAVLVAALLTALVGLSPGPAAAADPAQGVAFGTIKFPQKDSPNLKVVLFTKNWDYLGSASANGGSYYLPLDAGTYRLQFVDQRPVYNTKKYAPTDILVTVPANGRVSKKVAMTKGASITGTVKAKGKKAKKAKVVAANQSEQSFTTTANKKGQFAIGGLPEGKYSLFSYDNKHQWVDKSVYAGKLKSGKSKNLAINLKKKAGSLRVALFTSTDGKKKPVSGHPVVTAVSKKTGQFWSEKVKGGSALFQGLYPGKYKLVANEFGIWFGKTGAIQGAKVKSGRSGFGSFTYTKRGGWVTGDIVDASAPGFALTPDNGQVGATISLISASGALLAQTKSNAAGHFSLSGPITTQQRLTVKIDPSSSSGGYMTGAERCEFDSTSLDDVAVTVSKETEVGAIAVPRAPVPPEFTTCQS